MAMPTTPRSGVYRHYKNKQLYLLLYVAINSANERDLESEWAVYMALYPTHDGKGRVFTRPLSEFDDKFVMEVVVNPGTTD